MKLLKFTFTVLVLVFFTNKSKAQDILLKGDSTSRVNMFGPSQLKSVEISKKEEPRKPKGNYSTKGFRVQIFSGTDRQAAYDARREFSIAFPQHNSYITFAAPNYKVRVGDFKEKKEAENLSAAIGNLFPQLTVIADIVNIKATSEVKKDK